MDVVDEAGEDDHLIQTSNTSTYSTLSIEKHHTKRTGTFFFYLVYIVILYILYMQSYAFCFLLLGTIWSTIAHIITAVIGSGVLSLAWSTAQLGWIGGPVALLCFAVLTYVSSCLLIDCYRSPDSVTGARNPTYMDAVRVNLGKDLTELSAISLDHGCSGNAD